MPFQPATSLVRARRYNKPPELASLALLLCEDLTNSRAVFSAAVPEAMLLRGTRTLVRR